jgi:hypothetical protein
MFSCFKNTLPTPVKLHTGFKLPIEYTNPANIHDISKQVADDLELQSMYNHILKPDHEFAKQIVPNWCQKFSSDAQFLNETQQVVRRIPEYLENANLKTPVAEITELWANTKEDTRFLEKNSYMEWDAIKSLNQSSSFLQAMSVINMSSPILSLIIPIIFFIFPFVLLKFQGVPITFTIYIDVLKNVARNHFIGSLIQNIQSISWDKLVYLLMTAGMYMLQIYQNYNACIRFYNNTNKMNNQLCVLNEYLTASIHNIGIFVQLNNELPTYTEFCRTAQANANTLQRLQNALQSIKPFQVGFSKVAEIGYMLKYYYQIHSDPEYEHSIKYAVGFDGFMRTLVGVSDTIQTNKTAFATFGTENQCVLTKQYYPAYANTKHTKNSCDLTTNMVITGPNASGKTTMLKTTLLNIIMTQQFGCGFYGSFVLHPYTHVHSYLNIPDTSGRDSLFQAESRRCKDILDIVDATKTPAARHFCIFDELYSGTNPTEAISAANAFLLYLTMKSNVSFMLTTHYVSLCKKLRGSPQITNYKMDAQYNETQHRMEYLYRLKRGISKIKGGLAVLEEMNYPLEILATIRANPT